jgi:hypothetical protein
MRCACARPVSVISDSLVHPCIRPWSFQVLQGCGGRGVGDERASRHTLPRMGCDARRGAVGAAATAPPVPVTHEHDALRLLAFRCSRVRLPLPRLQVRCQRGGLLQRACAPACAPAGLASRCPIAPAPGAKQQHKRAWAADRRCLQRQTGAAARVDDPAPPSRARQRAGDCWHASYWSRAGHELGGSGAQRPGAW